MASLAQDTYSMIFEMPVVDGPQYFAAIATVLLNANIFVSAVRTGLGVNTAIGTSETLLEIEFTVDKNSKTDAQVQFIANQIATITSTVHRQTTKSLVNILVPATPAPIVSAPSTIIGTDVSGQISVGAVGTANIVVTFGTPYFSAPIVVHSYSTNLCSVSCVATATGIVFQANNNQINGKKINYLCS